MTTKALVIVESPTKARTISKFLPKGFIVEASIGHVRDLPTSAAEIPAKIKGEPWARLGINVEEDFAPVYVVPAEKKKQVKRLKDALKGVDVLYLATDEDREGESISWHLLELLDAKDVEVKRLVFHEITKSAIQEALENPRQLDESLVRAQETRRILDRLYGYEVSPILWRKVAPRLSAGRVQSVTVRIVVERERERQRFVKSTFWDLLADFEADQGPRFSTVLSTLDGKRIARGKDFDSLTGELIKDSGPNAAVLVTEERAKQLEQSLLKSDWTVQKVERKPYTDRPAPPFTTSTLQQEANRKLRLSARASMQAAQRLYENGLITYMRTDSTTLSKEAVTQTRDQIQALYGKEFLPDKPREYVTKVKNAQEAHEAIRPSGDFLKPEELKNHAAGLGDRERKLYDLIWKRTMACQMADAHGHRMSLKIGDGTAVFQASGKTIEFPGYLRAYVEGADDPDAELADKDTTLPSVTEGQSIDLKQLESKSHTTQPPARYTEASLVKELEARGIGRPSTYASIIDTILHRQYVVKQGTALVPTFVAFAVVKLMEDHFTRLVDVQFTANMENDLDEISLGTREAVPYLKDFYFGIDGAVGLKKLVEGDIDARTVCTLPLGKDSQDRQINVRVGRYGPYLEREQEPGAEETDRATIPDGLAPDELNLEKAEELLDKGSGPIELGVDEETESKVYVKTGRYGPYFQLGENDESPKMKSLLPGWEMETVTLDQALSMLRLPRKLGVDAESGEDIFVDYGRYGAYVKRGADARSLEKPEDVFDATLELALKKLAEEPARGRGRRASKVLKELGVDEKTESPVKLLQGPYGPYVSDGTTNASVPKGTEVEAVTLDLAIDLIRVREATGKSKRKAKKKASRKKAAKKKTAKKTAKKAAKKKATKKKASKKAGS